MNTGGMSYSAAGPPRTARVSAVCRALFNDVAQRLASGNKHEQRRMVREQMARLQLRPGGKVLDFGCGTGLFARPVSELGLEYVGYDIDAALVRYANWLRPSRSFVSDLSQARSLGPYDAVMSNCCFHHISDVELRNALLPEIAAMLRPQGIFLLVDVLPPGPMAPWLSRAYVGMEQGGTRRSETQLDRLVGDRFVVHAKRSYRTHFLSLANHWNPIWTDMVAYELSAR